MDNAQVGGTTANVLFAGLLQGVLGVYEVQLQLNDNLPTNPQTQMWIAQNVFTSNIVTIPIVALVPPVTSSAVPAHETGSARKKVHLNGIAAQRGFAAALSARYFRSSS